MSNSVNTYSSFEFTDSTVSSLRKRILLLITISTLIVAFSFGASFYFAFISSGSAISGQIPELAPVVSKMKSLLVLNTFGLVGVIIASMFILNRLTAWRIFEPLGAIQKNMVSISGGRLPKIESEKRGNAFSKMHSAFRYMLSSIREKENGEIEQLELCIKSIQAGKSSEATASIERIIEEKSKYLVGEKAKKSVEEKVDEENQQEELVHPSS